MLMDIAAPLMAVMLTARLINCPMAMPVSRSRRP
jgi:hypothetical protein